MPGRPPVSVVVPVLGSPEEGRALLTALARMQRGPDDEVVIVDNSPDGALAALAAPEGMRIVAAPDRPSSYYARNVGVEASTRDWLLFVDADCRPEPGLLAAYFAEPIDGGCGLLAGHVDSTGDPRRLLVRYARSRRHLDVDAMVDAPYKPAGVTANLLVRRAAWEAVGGFVEGIRSGGDSDFCWRVQDAGWTFVSRPAAVVRHAHRETLRAMLRQTARYASSRRWLRMRHPGSFAPDEGAAGLARAVAATGRWALSGKPERARLRAVDAVVIASELLGARQPNISRAARPRVVPGGDLVMLTDSFPELSETFIVAEARGLRDLGLRVRVESLMRARTPDRAADRELRPIHAEDDASASRSSSLLWLVARHPIGCAGDLVARRRWRREEPVPPLRVVAPLARRVAEGGERHVHAHFAKGAALTALRLHRITGVPYSVTAHAYDIYREPSNLAEKLGCAAVATSGCAYTVADLRAIAGAGHADRVHVVVMGVDGGRFARVTPHGADRRVLAVGRLVEKKGFEHLLRAAAILRDRDAVDEVVLVGDGPLRARLRALSAELGLEGVVTFAGSRTQDAVRGELEHVAVLAMPCVVAADGDRDSMPVVVKEALAMEVPVVATDEVGLPELVRDDWGRLVAPGDHSALADALGELLALEPRERAAMGAAGRAFVLEHCDVNREAARLAELLGLDYSTSIRERIDALTMAPISTRSSTR